MQSLLSTGSRNVMFVASWSTAIHDCCARLRSELRLASTTTISITISSSSSSNNSETVQGYQTWGASFLPRDAMHPPY